jgi:1,4-dihydroxy-6-naphthoate synthase
MNITLACSPDADDLFMMRALLDERIDTRGYTFDITTEPTHALNTIAAGGDGPDVIAISVAHYPAIADKYQMLPHGGSMGEGYGPVVVSTTPMSLDDLTGKRVAIPGHTTTAWMVLQLITSTNPVVVPITPYARIFEALREGVVDAGLVIHEGRLTYEAEGMHRIIDIGEWWHEQTDGLPLPLGANTIRRSLGEKVIREVSTLLKESILHGLRERDDAINWLLAKGGALTSHQEVDEYLRMYANERTVDYGDTGRAAIDELFRRAGLNICVDYAP